MEKVVQTFAVTVKEKKIVTFLMELVQMDVKMIIPVSNATLYVSKLFIWIVSLR